MVDMLQKLNVMLISHCDDLESIIEPSGLPSTESSTIKFVLSRVRWLELESLSKLKSFYPKMHTTEWPALQKLIVTGCTNVKIFALENLNSQLDIPANEQPLFWFSKAKIGKSSESCESALQRLMGINIADSSEEA
ncbi:disease resistance protein, partial [Corchorus olitorius]